jgi:type VI secretion system protein ImpE
MSGTDQTAATLFRAGKLDDAVAAAQAALRKAPTDLNARVLLGELLAFSGNLERADVVLDAASAIDPSTALVVAEFRQLIRADMARRQLFRDGRVPEFLSDPTETQRLQLAALVALRAGDLAEATKQASAAEAMRPRAAGQHGDAAFDDLRDADDLLAGSFEVLTTTGKYFWIPTERVLTLEFHAPKRPRDLLWRRASMSVDQGPDGDVYLPVVYATDETMTDPQRLGRETDWREAPDTPVRGIGQRLFMVGEEALGIMDLGNIRFIVSPAGAGSA